MPFTSDEHLVLRFSSQRDRQEIAICENQRKRVQSPQACSMIITHLDEVAGVVFERHRSVHRLLYAPSLDAKRLLTHIQHCRRLNCFFVGGEARCGYPPGYKTGRAVHSRYAPGVPVPPGDGNLVAGPSRGDIAKVSITRT